ncbi:MAG: hypothetical protein WA604_19760 [Candidatus Sulfotelmatobacter sp.]
MVALMLLSVSSMNANDKKKKHAERGMLEKMEAVPCGAKQRGLAGLGALYGSIGITHVNSDEKLCPQYLLRTDEMEYHIRPVDGKHPVILPVGHEGEFKIKKDHLYLKVPDGDHKTRAYQVVSMKPLDSTTDLQGSAYKAPEKPLGQLPATLADRPVAKSPGNSVNPPQ